MSFLPFKWRSRDTKASNGPMTRSSSITPNTRPSGTKHLNSGPRGRAKTALVVPSGGTWNPDTRPDGETFRARTTREAEALVVLRHRCRAPHGPGAADDGHGRHRGVAFIAELRGGGSDARDVREPLATVTASGNHHTLVRHNTARGDAGQMCTPPRTCAHPDDHRAPVSRRLAGRRPGRR